MTVASNDGRTTENHNPEVKPNQNSIGSKTRNQAVVVNQADANKMSLKFRPE